MSPSEAAIRLEEARRALDNALADAKRTNDFLLGRLDTLTAAAAGVIQSIQIAQDGAYELEVPPIIAYNLNKLAAALAVEEPHE